jgi:hypothetical protein
LGFVQERKSVLFLAQAFRIPITCFMDEYSLFTSKLQACDLIVLTEADEIRTYCRFYAHGLYQDRMFISDVSMKECLTQLSSEEDIIDWNGVQNLRKKYCEIVPNSEEMGEVKATQAI